MSELTVKIFNSQTCTTWRVLSTFLHRWDWRVSSPWLVTWSSLFTALWSFLRCVYYVVLCATMPVYTNTMPYLSIHLSWSAGYTIEAARYRACLLPCVWRMGAPERLGTCWVRERLAPAYREEGHVHIFFFACVHYGFNCRFFRFAAILSFLTFVTRVSGAVELFWFWLERFLIWVSVFE